MATKKKGLSRGFPKAAGKEVPKALLGENPEDSLGIDPVNHPSHYQGKVECIDALEACLEGLTGFEGFCTGNTMKYLWRWKRKGSGQDDLSKAAWYIERLKDHVQERGA